MTDLSAGPARVIGVLGAGTMGSGIAQLACRAGARTLVYDPDAEALERGRARIASDLDKLVARGKLEARAAQEALACLEPVDALDALAECELVIEAAPESLELKRKLVGALDAVVAPACVIATNTSSLLVTAVAAGSAHPQRVVGMHFFNPPPIMRLLEVVAGEESSAAALAVADATGVAMGKDVIRAYDGPGFVVNRCNRPYSLEALRLLTDGVASVEDIDRVMRSGGGFRMGPFELMDLVGIDVGFEVAKSFYEQSFGEPRWRPSPISARYVAAGRSGRKSGRGFYRYDNGPHRPEDPEAPTVGGGDGVVVVAGDGTLAGELRAAAADAGWTVADTDVAEAGVVVDCRLRRDGELPAGPRVVLCDAGSLARLDSSGGAAGFYALAPFAQSGLVELTRTVTTEDEAAAAAVLFFATLGKHAVWVGDAPGLVSGRIVCQIINESCFALTERVGTAGDVDTGLVLALNHPRGPFAWSRTIGLGRVLATLDALHEELHDDRYRAAPLIRSLVNQGLEVP